MTKPLGAQIAYFVAYYRRMNWELKPWFILELCEEACYDDDDDFGWRTNHDAIRYLKEQAGVAND